LSYRKAIVVGAGVGLLLAIALATIDRILVARLEWSVPACPDPRCTRAAEIVEAEPMHVLMAFALGFACRVRVVPATARRATAWAMTHTLLNRGRSLRVASMPPVDPRPRLLGNLAGNQSRFPLGTPHSVRTPTTPS
jgi:hypothetical protein